MYETLKSILVDDLRINEDAITPEATLDEAGLDSLTTVELSLVLGKRFGLEITDDELLDSVTIGGIVDLMTQRVSARLTQPTG